jgi:hypothetical protein
MQDMSKRKSTTYGFARTSKLVQSRVRSVTESRGFAQSRVLTHWEEIVGPDIAAMTRPVEVSYGGKGGFGASLVVLTTGAHAPLVQMKLGEILERINAVYGYRAIARIRVTQTAPTGFAQGQVDFVHRPKAAQPKPDPAAEARAREVTQDVGDDSLRAALERLAANVISKQGRAKSRPTKF